MRKQQDLGGNHKATPRFHDNLPSTISCLWPFYTDVCGCKRCTRPVWQAYTLHMCQTMSFCFHFVCTTVRFSKVGQTTSTFARSGEDLRAKRKAGVNRPSVSPTMSLPSKPCQGGWCSIWQRQSTGSQRTGPTSSGCSRAKTQSWTGFVHTYR